jgi:hypothetical protein
LPLHIVPMPAAALPAVHSRDLLRAWRRAAAAAEASAWAEARTFLFQRPDGACTPLCLTDADAACWAASVEAQVGLDTIHGIALCLRLLALVDAMARMAWLRGLFALDADGADFHPALLEAAARLPLTDHARLDETALRAALSRRLPRTGVPA